MLRDSFVIQERLGVGATAEVFRAVERSSGEIRALKIFTPLVLSDPDTVRRIEGEVSALRRLSHPNIVRLYASHSAEHELALELEFVDGSDLRQWRKNYDLRLHEPLLWLLCQVARGIGCAHEHGILHRDLKPENILISKTGEVKLTDFGLARQLDAITMTKSGLLAGSLGYMAPEMLDGERCTQQSDVFAFGSVAYELLTGVNAFAGPNPQAVMKKMFSGQIRPLGEMVPGLPAPLEKLVHACLERNPTKRPVSIWHVEAELMSALSASPLLRQCRALVSVSSRAVSLEAVFVEKKKTLESRRAELAIDAPRGDWIQLAREWSFVFPDSPAPAEILAGLTEEKRAFPYLRVSAALLLLLFFGTGAWIALRPTPRAPSVAAVPPPSPAVDEVATRAAAPMPSPVIENPAPRPARGWIRVEADDDVRVLVDDLEIPRARWNRIPASPGVRKLRLIKEGFMPIENNIEVRSGKVAVVRAKGGL